MPSLLDFGGHLQLIDGRVKLDENPLFEHFLSVEDDVMRPNLLAAHFVATLYPWLDTLPALRLFVTLSILAIVAALVVLARSFERDARQVVLALPFVWAGTVSAGTVNYIGAIALLLLAIATARRAGQRGDPSSYLALALLGVACFFVHAIGYVLVICYCAGVLVISARRPRHLLVLFAFAPSLALFFEWLLRSRQRGTLPPLTPSPAVSLGSRLEMFGLDIFNFTSGWLDSGCLALVVGIALVLAIRARSPARPRHAAGLQPDDRSRPVAAVLRLRALLGRNVLATVAATLALALLLLPMQIHRVTLWIRFTSPLMIVALLAPRLRLDSRLARSLIAAAFVAVLLFAARLSVAQWNFQRDELAPVLELADRMPRRALAHCAGVMGRLHPAMPFRAPLWHNCDAVLQYYRGAFAGGGFAEDGLNGVHLRERTIPFWLETQWWNDGRLPFYDYIVARGPARHPPRFALVAEARGEGPKRPTWRLYRRRELPRGGLR